jgi:hypothetical protein
MVFVCVRLATERGANPMDNTKVPTTAPMVIEGEARTITEPRKADAPDALHLLTLLAVGGGVEAADLILTHTRAWHARFTAEPRLLPMPKDESATDLLRYALIGLIFDTEEKLRDNTAQWGNQLLLTIGQASEKARPITDSWLMGPLRRPLQSLQRQMEGDLARLIRRGRMEEAVSRLMATDVTDEMVTVVLEYLGTKPEVRTLTNEQGVTMAGEVIDQVRDQSMAADSYVESIVRRILRRGPRQPSPPSSSGA